MLLLLSLLVACQPSLTYSETKIVQTCRESAETDAAHINLLANDGWRYEGPLYNNGLNCTAGLWVK